MSTQSTFIHSEWAWTSRWQQPHEQKQQQLLYKQQPLFFHCKLPRKRRKMFANVDETACSWYNVLRYVVFNKLQKNLSRILRTHLFDKLYSNNLTCDLIHSNSHRQQDSAEKEKRWRKKNAIEETSYTKDKQSTTQIQGKHNQIFAKSTNEINSKAPRNTHTQRNNTHTHTHIKNCLNKVNQQELKNMVYLIRLLDSQPSVEFQTVWWH